MSNLSEFTKLKYIGHCNCGQCQLVPLPVLIEAAHSHDALVSALAGLLERYTSLVNCGDCGNWDPETEDEVKAARAALAPSQNVMPIKETTP